MSGKFKPLTVSEIKHNEYSCKYYQQNKAKISLRLKEKRQEKKANTYKKCRDEILKLSSVDNWEDAMKEWVLMGYNDENEGSACICGVAIKYEYLIWNSQNKNEAIIGCVCYENIGLDKRKLDYLNTETKAFKDGRFFEQYRYCYANKLITEWEYNFLESLKRFNHFSDKQEAIITKLKTKIDIALKNKIEKGMVNYTKFECAEFDKYVAFLAQEEQNKDCLITED